MRMLVLMGLLVAGHPSGPDAAHAAPADTTSCRDWRACRAEALAAESAGDLERFHDVAWRTVQLGPEKDPALMYLLARAQAARGRPSDAFVMLRRLAELGVATDADTLDVFARVRARDGWSELEALTRTASRRVTSAGDEEVTAAAAIPTLSGGDAPDKALDAASNPSGRTLPPLAGAEVLTPLVGQETLRLDDLRIARGGFAYDAVSNRFLVGSSTDRKIVVVDGPSQRVADLVRGDSAGFRDMVAMEIDTKRGDLWVLSNDSPSATDHGAATLHRLQLVAGRPLGRRDAPAGDRPVRLTDLSIAPSGNVLTLDAEGRRLYRARPDGATLERLMTLDVEAPAAVAASSDTTCYVAFATGVARVDLGRRTLEPLTVPSGEDMRGITQLWWHEGSLVGAQTLASGERRLRQWVLGRRGTAVTAVRAIDVALPPADLPLAVTLAGHDLFVATEERGPATSEDGPRQVVVRRVRLQP